MILNRLKDIIRSSINDQFDRLKDGDFNFDFDEWKKYDDEYEETQKQQQQYEQQYKSTHQQNTQNNKELKYYQILEVAPGSSFEVIKKSYRRLMKMYHPDLFRNDEEKHKTALEISRQLNEAYNHFEEKFGK